MALKRRTFRRRTRVIRLPLGFDALAVLESVNWKRPDLKGRELLFIRPEVSSPISVDRLICPSVFQPEIQRTPEMDLFLTRFPHSLPVERTTLQTSRDWLDSDVNTLGLWIDVHRMLRWLGERPDVKQSVRLTVAIAVFLDNVSVLAPLWQAVSHEGVTPSTVPPEWTTLGYDVADEGQVSALSNCQFEEDDMVEARRRWREHINESGLFDNASVAAEFVNSANERVPEHAPFYVYEILRTNH
jgi:hypothetical protein